MDFDQTCIDTLFGGREDRAYPDSEFVVASTLAKWKKLEPNAINFSQGFSQNAVSTSCYYVYARGNFCCLLITFADSWVPDQARHLVRPDLYPNCLTPGWYWKKIQHPKSKIWRNYKVRRNNKSNVWKSKSKSKYTSSQICQFWTFSQ